MSQELQLRTASIGGKEQPATSSMDIAARFGKNHKDVLKAIRNLEIDADSHERNFAPIEIDVEIRKGVFRKSPGFLMSETGFQLLGFGFTGTEAMKWKLRYIEAFRLLRERIQRVTLEEAANKLPDRSSDPKIVAVAQYSAEMELSSRLWKTLGLKKADRDAEAIEVGRRIEKRFLVTDLVPPQLANKAIRVTSSTRKVVETAHSGKHIKPVRLAINLGYAGNTKSASCINLALCAMGLQMRHPTATNGYLAIGAGVQIANKDDVGANKDLVVGWEPVRTTQALQDYFTANPSKAPKK